MVAINKIVDILRLSHLAIMLKTVIHWCLIVLDTRVWSQKYDIITAQLGKQLKQNKQKRNTQTNDGSDIRITKWNGLTHFQ